HLPDVAHASGDIWAAGTAATSAQSDLVSNFLRELRSCAKASSEEPIVLEVRGFASTREFTFTDKNGKPTDTRPDTDDLNLRASNDRAEATQQVLAAAVKENGGPFVLRSVHQYAT